jgi:hypothetical protein
MTDKQATGLAFRTPLGRTVLVAIIVATGVHGVVWFVAQSLLGLGFNDALSAAQSQAFLCLTWLVAALCIWALKLPKSRLLATLNILGTAAFVTLLGSVGGYVRLNWGQASEGRNLVSFILFGMAISFAQVVMAVPSSLVFGRLCLRGGGAKGAQDLP